MYDNKNRFSSGLMYVKNDKALIGLLQCIIEFINQSNKFMTEMTVLSIYYEANKSTVGILPTFWNSPNIPTIAYANFTPFNISTADLKGSASLNVIR